MQTHAELAKLVQTQNISNSAWESLLVKNCRGPSLVPGCLYLLKRWDTLSTPNWSNPFRVVEFLGAGKVIDGKREMYVENPKLKLMGDDDYYYFKSYVERMPHQVDMPDEECEIHAFMHENCLCINSEAVRVTFYTIKGCDYPEGVSEAPAMPAKGLKAAKHSADSSVKQRKNREEDFGIKYDEAEDDGVGCGVEVDPIGMWDLKPRKEARAT